MLQPVLQPRLRPTPARRQRGVAVITALLLTTLAITIVASLFWQQQVQVRSIENQRLQLQKQWILRGALDWARLILQEDSKYTPTDNLTEPWAVPLEEVRLDQYVENGNTDADIADAALSGSIQDAQARFNLRNLCPGGTISPPDVAAFGRLLAGFGLNSSLAQPTADLMSAAYSKTMAPGNAAAAGDNMPASQPMDIMQIEDLLAVPGFTPAMLAKLKDYLIVLPEPTPINLNTASAEVIAAKTGISRADATALVASRERLYFIDTADERLRVPVPRPLATDYAVKTAYFLVNGKVRLDRASLEMQALIKRTGTVTRVLWIREN